MTYIILDEGDKAHGFEQNYLLAIFREPENYDSLKKTLQDVKKEVSTITHINVDDEDYRIQYYMGGLEIFSNTSNMYTTLMAVTYTDVFYNNYMQGTIVQKSTYSCIWCKCSSSERYDPTRKWSITDVTKGARTIQ